MVVTLKPTTVILLSSHCFSSAISIGGSYTSRLALPASPRPRFPHVQALPVTKATTSYNDEHEATDRNNHVASGAAAAPKTLSRYEPSIWGDYFLDYEPKPLQRSEKWMSARADQLKEDVDMLFKSCSCTMERIILLDSVQRLGIDHHFKKQVDIALNQIFEDEFSSFSLHQVALRFGLLRRHGLWVSPVYHADVFNKFKNEDGSFRTDITNDPKGLLYLYNAAHLLVHGETSLEEAISFARHHLELMRETLKSPLAEQVKRALRVPLSRTLKRVETLHYISEYKHEERHNPTLLELAKLDFNLLQHVHLKELKYLTRWWHDFYTCVGLNYARDRLVEGYIWCYAVYHEKEFALSRIFLTKQLMLISLMDDTYDAHATIEECRQLNAAIQRWDESATSILPDYLKRFYTELMRVFKDATREVTICDTYHVAYAQKAFQDLSIYYLQEVEWLNQNHKPCFKDHLRLSAMSIGSPTLCVGLMVGMGDLVTRETFEWAASYPKVAIACGKIARLMDDMAAFKGGKAKGDMASSIECYMVEHRVTSEVAIYKILSLLEDEWKTLNQAPFDHHTHLPVLQRIINFANSMPLFYREKDAYTFSMHLKDTVDSLFVEPIPM
ncbi:tau-cadinol synthase-like isoform X1 [Hordeum vulgare subsp. vulgare]|uniref:tau-cadinol synthase-like isoform X1 n=1 Tax=Hordeum vulgare subsp. vulgare TaxID=112509 RepID=UPI001D1A562B|nr:tau-cadinol synthase-like isoform X1 [Hordeum vulgare subsp. vulgare]XP_044964597.1 tau-cadinol synthase-like isoform X1 [Hordeum vulgare subsp. vulgare]